MSRVGHCDLVTGIYSNGTTTTRAGYTLLDSQFVTRHLENFGAIELPRAEYRTLLAEAIAREADFRSDYREGEVVEFLRSLS